MDTSVWVDHFRHGNDFLIDLLEMDLVMMHPLVVGEIACGTPPNRAHTLVYMERLQMTQQASIREAMALIEQERLFGMGCGLVDVLLLASTLETPGAELWTLDKRLNALAERFSVMHQPSLH